MLQVVRQPEHLHRHVPQLGLQDQTDHQPEPPHQHASQQAELQHLHVNQEGLQPLHVSQAEHHPRIVPRHQPVNHHHPVHQIHIVVEAGVAEAIVAEEAEAVIVVVEVAVEVVVVAEGEDRMNASNLKTKRRCLRSHFNHPVMSLRA